MASSARSRAPEGDWRSKSYLVLRQSDLRFEKLIASGGFGEVWLGRHIPTNQQVAIKKLSATKLSAAEENEIHVNVQLRHRFILGFIGFTDRPPFCIVTEYMPNSTLYSALHRSESRVRLSATDCTMIALAVAMGMEYVHSKRIIHRDLKSMNILLDQKNEPVICDFGISVMENDDETLPTTFGTAAILAPEEHSQAPITPAVDVYSYGMLLWEMLTRKIPFEGKDKVQITYAVVNKGERPEIPSDTPKALADLISCCWAQDPQDRPTFGDIVAAFQSGDVEFAGTVRSALKNFLAYYGGPTSPKMGSPQRGPMSARREVCYSPACHDPELFEMTSAAEVLEMLENPENESRVESALSLLNRNTKVQVQLGARLWTGLLSLAVQKNGQDKFSYFDNVCATLVNMAQSQRNLDKLTEITNLHSYLTSDTLDFFLYVVSFVPSAVTPKIVTELERMVLSKSYDELVKEKAVKLLCVIQENITDQTMRSFIAKFMFNNAESAIDCSYGHLMLKSVAVYSKKPDKAKDKIMPVVVKFLQSSVPTNVAVGYNFVNYWAPQSAFVGLEDVLIHIASDNERLREVALEYLRVHFMDTKDINMIQRIVFGALDTYERYHCERAAIVMFHFASLGFKEVFTNPAFQTHFLTISDDMAADIVQLLIFMMRMDPDLLMHKSIPRYLASVLRYGNNQQFVIVCILINRDRVTSEFLAHLEDAGVLAMICDRVTNCENLEVLKYAAKALVRFTSSRDSDQYECMIPSLVAQLDTGIEAEPILILLASLAQYSHLHQPLRQSGVLSHLSVFHGSMKSAPYADFLRQKLT